MAKLLNLKKLLLFEQQLEEKENNPQFSSLVSRDWKSFEGIFHSNWKLIEELFDCERVRRRGKKIFFNV